MPTYTKMQHDYILQLNRKNTTFYPDGASLGVYNGAHIVTGETVTFTTASAFYVSGSSIAGSVTLNNGTQVSINDFVQPAVSKSDGFVFETQSDIVPFGITSATSNNATTHIVVLEP